MDLDAPSPVFGMENFKYSMGPIISGHVHVSGCYEKDFIIVGHHIDGVMEKSNLKGI